MNEQVPAEKSDTPRTDEAEAIRQNGGDVSDIFAAMRQLERELTEAMCSLSREETVRNILTSDNARLRELSRTAACPPSTTPPRELLYEGYIYIREDRS